MNRLTKLFLGANIPDSRRIVTREALDNFLTHAVTPDFPGFTVQDATESWEGKTEPAWILTIVHDSKQDTLVRIARIGMAYKVAFKQSAVLVVSQEVSARIV